MAEDNNNNTEVFIYTEGAVVPNNVVRVRVHPSVTIIPSQAFCNRYNLKEIELCDGLLEIGPCAFSKCKALKRINIPSTVTAIRNNAFSQCNKMEEVVLGEGLVEIGDCALASTRLTQLRIPPLISTVHNSLLSCCKGLFSVELPECVTQMNLTAFFVCHILRNIALPPSALVSEHSADNTFVGCTDLLQLFDTERQVINSLKHRFDKLPIHKMIYYQSYNNVTVGQLISATLDVEGNLTGKQDCLGMTPLHILACSAVQNLELYIVLITKFPEALVTEDRWGAVPLLYAVWGCAPDEIVQFLVHNYKSIYPDHVLNWSKMIQTLGRANMPKEAPGVIQNLLDLQKDSFSNQSIDWDKALKNSGTIGAISFAFLVKCSITKRVNAIGLKQYRDTIMDSIKPGTFCSNRKRMKNLSEVHVMVRQYETEYQSLKEAISVLELVLWKNSINKTMPCDGRELGKRKFDESDLRVQCRVSCGSDIIIRNVLPYLYQCQRTK